MERNPFLPGHYPFYRPGYNPISGLRALMAFQRMLRECCNCDDLTSA